MPEPVKRGQRYMPGLDGLRAIAVLAVIVYHLGFTWAPGGLLGVGVFFTLSGYLITDLLLAQASRGRIDLKAFWFARARRLLPGLYVMLVVVLAWVTVIGPHQTSDFRTAAGTAILYVNNWWLIFHDVSYFQAFAAPAPLNHLWSLSVEEQFYIVWPFLMVIGVKVIPQVATTGTRVRLALVTLGLALVSMVLMIVLYHPGIDPSRVYYGTDTRAMELLTGAALAMVWPSRRLRADVAPGAARIIDGAGAAGLLCIAIMFWRSNEYSPFLYRGGFLLLSAATVLVVAALVHPASRLGPLIGSQPLRWIGERSYGIYLWHFPIIVLTTPAASHGVHPARAFVQLAATSWRFIEDPVRHGALGRLRATVARGEWRRQPIPRPALGAMAGSAVLLIAALAGVAGAGVKKESKNTPGKLTVAKTITVKHVSRRPAHSTSCSSVVHIGDSTSEGLVSANYLPDPRQRISAQYARVGISTQHLEVSGARSIYERYRGLPNADDVAMSWKQQNFHGCWVLALGTNEAANVAAGSQFGFDQRIDAMMQTIGDQPVMWVNVKSVVASGPYAGSNMRLWDDALRKACDRYPNMRIYDWASMVKDEWFIPDGIHFTSIGYAARGKLIANALRLAFPSTGGTARTNSSDCLIHPKPIPASQLTPVTPTTTTATPAPATTPAPAAAPS